jgi:hypothetical protein
MEDWNMPRFDAISPFSEAEETRIIPVVETPPNNPWIIRNSRRRWRLWVKAIRRNIKECVNMPLM